MIRKLQAPQSPYNWSALSQEELESNQTSTLGISLPEFHEFEENPFFCSPTCYTICLYPQSSFSTDDGIVDELVHRGSCQDWGDIL